jgi:GAF domain-containing protein
MRRRSRAGGEPVKTRRHKTATLTRRNGPKDMCRRSSSTANLRKQLDDRTHELDDRTRELKEALEQQAATADVLKVISRSTFELQPVLDTLVKSAARLCEADMVSITRPRDGAMQFAANFGLPQEFEEIAKRTSFVPGRGTVVGRVLLAGKPVQIADVEADQEYTFTEGQRVAGFRTVLAVPLEREGEIIGVIVLNRTKVEPFSNKQIALVQNFAAQAVIAIENTRLLTELRQSLEQQTATSEVLGVISSSPGELEPVFQTMLQNATRLCDAKFGVLFEFADGAFRALSNLNTPPALVDFNRELRVWGPHTALGRLAHTRQTVHVEDALVDRAYREDTGRKAAVQLGGVRTLLAVPMLKEDVLVGAITIFRQEVRPFTDKQIALVTNFAAQAVIAIENARLLNELRQRTDDLTESLEQQTATSDVLQVISSSPGELEPVFNALLANAIRICEATFGNLLLFEGSAFRAVAVQGEERYNDYLRRNPVIDLRENSGVPLDRIAKTKQVVHVPDLRTDPSYVAKREPIVRLVEVAGIRTLVGVPMLKEGELIGSIHMYRQEVRPFTAKQIALVQNFAAQAVIAIENTRLLNELKQSLEQQTATADVLRVISSSPTNVQPVFDSIAESAVRLCNGQFSFVLRFDGQVIDFASSFGLSAEGLDAFRRMMPRPAGEDTTSGRAILRRAVVEIPDVNADVAYGAPARDLARIVTYRSAVSVPLLHEGNPIGAITVARATAGTFPARQIALLQSFADQAVIAIRNVRLFDEVQARTGELSRSVEELRALSEVSQAINSTLDVEAVLTTIVAKAVHLSGTEAGTIYTFDESRQEFRLRATHGMEQTMIAAIDNRRAGIGDTAIGKAAAERRPVQIPDILAESSLVLDIIVRAGFRSLLIVPLLRPGQIVGALVVRRKAPGEFPKSTVELLQTFAEQSVLAIQNARLFREIEAKSRELEQASQHKSQFLANMSHELRTPLNAILGYTELMTDGAYGDPSEKMLGVLKRLEANGRHLLGLINDVLDLSKIEAGQLVLELSDYSIQDIAQTVRSALEPLAADKKLAFKVEVAPQLPPGRGDGRRLTQVLINLVGNAIKFTDAGEVAIKAEVSNGSFHVSVRDTGPGISAADQVKLFQEFQQADNAITRKKGGTGLGLAISKRIIEMHGGRIWVESQPGQGSTFTFTLPVVVERQAETA